MKDEQWKMLDVLRRYMGMQRASERADSFGDDFIEYLERFVDERARDVAREEIGNATHLEEAAAATIRANTDLDDLNSAIGKYVSIRKQLDETRANWCAEVAGLHEERDALKARLAAMREQFTISSSTRERELEARVVEVEADLDRMADLVNKNAALETECGHAERDEAQHAYERTCRALDKAEGDRDALKVRVEELEGKIRSFVVNPNDYTISQLHHVVERGPGGERPSPPTTYDHDRADCVPDECDMPEHLPGGEQPEPKLPKGRSYHPDRKTDDEIRADAAAGARADLAAGLPAHACPKCGRTHNRGFVDGVSAYRCLHCGDVFAPREQPEPPESLEDLWRRVETAAGSRVRVCHDAVGYRAEHDTVGNPDFIPGLAKTARAALTNLLAKLEGGDGG